MIDFFCSLDFFIFWWPLLYLLESHLARTINIVIFLEWRDWGEKRIDTIRLNCSSKTGNWFAYYFSEIAFLNSNAAIRLSSDWRLFQVMLITLFWDDVIISIFIILIAIICIIINLVNIIICLREREEREREISYQVQSNNNFVDLDWYHAIIVFIKRLRRRGLKKKKKKKTLVMKKKNEDIEERKKMRYNLYEINRFFSSFETFQEIGCLEVFWNWIVQTRDYLVNSFFPGLFIVFAGLNGFEKFLQRLFNHEAESVRNLVD